MQQTWRDLLGQIISEGQEKQRIAKEVRVKPLTLQRWAHGESKPREENIRQLVNVLPRDYFQQFIKLAVTDFPGLANEDSTEGNSAFDLPSEFYARVLEAYATTPESLYPQAIYNLILQHAIEHLDPHRQGVALSVVRCVPPRVGTRVQSLQEICGRGTLPWSRDLDHERIFLGAESLAGAAVSNYHRVVVQNRNAHDIYYPVHWTEYEQSAAASPLRHKAKVAGCLLFLSAHANFFTETRLILLDRYADLLALAFEPTAFFNPPDVKLRVIPGYNVQKPYLRLFGQRATRKYMELAATPQPITLQEAQERVWQEIEDELLQIAQSMSV